MVTVGDLESILNRLQRLCASAGARSAAKDLQTLSDVLKPHAEKSVAAFCAETKARLSQLAEKPKRQSAPLNDSAISHHLEQLREAGTDQQTFDAAFERLKADKLLTSSDIGEIARQYADSVTKYKSIGAAHTAISKAFIRQARFINKLR